MADCYVVFREPRGLADIRVAATAMHQQFSCVIENAIMPAISAIDPNSERSGRNAFTV
jgi:hypothetical protein